MHFSARIIILGPYVKVLNQYVKLYYLFDQLFTRFDVEQLEETTKA